MYYNRSHSHFQQKKKKRKKIVKNRVFIENRRNHAKEEKAL